MQQEFKPKLNRNNYKCVCKAALTDSVHLRSAIQAETGIHQHVTELFQETSSGLFQTVVHDWLNVNMSGSI